MQRLIVEPNGQAILFGYVSPVKSKCPAIQKNCIDDIVSPALILNSDIIEFTIIAERRSLIHEKIFSMCIRVR